MGGGRNVANERARGAMQFPNGGVPTLQPNGTSPLVM